MWVRACVLAGALTGIFANPAPVRAEASAARRVLGNVRVWDRVEAKDASGEWRALRSGALLDGTELRTGPDGRAALELTNGDVVALGGSSSAALAGEGTPRVRLLSGRMALRLQPSSSLVVDTPIAAVALPSVRPVSASGPGEALVTLDDAAVTVRSFRGTFEATRAGTEPILIADNQSVTLGADAGAPPARATVAEPKGEQKDIWATLGIPPGIAAAMGVGLATAGGLTGAAASGAFSEESSETGPAADQGSPFRPIRR